MLEALHRECKDIAMVIAKEVHKNRTSSLNNEYFSLFKCVERVGITYIQHQLNWSTVYNYRTTLRLGPDGNFAFATHTIYHSNIDGTSSDTHVPVPTRCIFSSGMTHNRKYK